LFCQQMSTHALAISVRLYSPCCLVFTLVLWHCAIIITCTRDKSTSKRFTAWWLTIWLKQHLMASVDTC
jgi:hypothetical protein